MYDPKGLIRESYRIDGIDLQQCRSIFMDWAIGLPQDMDGPTQIKQLLDHYRPENPDHPMTEVLTEGQNRITVSGRRGGRQARKNQQ